MVMVRESRSKGRELEFLHCILDGHFFTYICCKNCNVCLKRPKINEKEAGVGPFFLKKTFLLLFPYGRKVFHCLNGHLPLMVEVSGPNDL